MTRPDGSPPGPNDRILLLAGQGLALGLVVAWITISASTIFLSTYGPELLLPVTYIGAACAGAFSSTTLAVAFRRRPLAAVATTVLTGLTAVLLVAWILLGRAGNEWVSFALLVLVPILVPVGFIFVVGQAGMLLDVRTLKALYARVVAGFALGVVTGGLAGPILLNALGGTEELLAAAAAASALLLALVGLARRRYPNELSRLEHDDGDHAAEHPTLRSLSRNRFVRLIVAFQMLSAVESQWLDFLVFDRAAQRYEDSSELARFVSRFAAIAYGADIVFLLLLAGLLLRRFGLRYGLAANSLGVLTVVVAIIATTTLHGSGAAIVFVLVVGARVVDLTLSDGASRTSLSAAYQAVPNRLRAVAQATVEGLAVPVAIGCSGVVLLIVDAAGYTDGLLLPVLTSLVVIAWFGVALVLYRDYGSNLLASLRGRTLDPAELTVDDESSLVVVDRLVESVDERDVRLGLDILTVAEHPALHLRLEQLAGDARDGVRRDALERLRLLAPHLAADAARAALHEPSPDVRAASIRVLGAAGAPSDLPAVAAHADDPAPLVRVAVAFALPRMDGQDGASRVSADVARFAASAAVDDRRLAALMLGECEPDGKVDRTPLRALLDDAEGDVVEAALAAVRWPCDADLLTDAARHIRDRRTAEATIEMLVRAGDAALDVVDAGLASEGLDRRAHELFVRVARDVGGPAAGAVLRGHLAHRDPEVGLAVMRALASLGPAGPVQDDAPDPRELAVVAQDLEHAAHVLRAVIAFEDEPSVSLLRGALLDELAVLRRRVIAGLSMRHGTAGLDRVAFQLAQRDPRAHALAIEWLDVTLTGEERAVIALLEPNLSLRDRSQRLSRRFPLEVLGTRAVLLEVARDEARWRPWIKACAIHAASTMARADLALLGEVAAASTPTGNAEASVLHETVTALRDRQLDLV